MFVSYIAACQGYNDTRGEKEVMSVKGTFFQFEELPVECPQCKHPRREIGGYMICTFCHHQQIMPLIVCGKKINTSDYHDYMEAADMIFAHFQVAQTRQQLSAIMQEGMFIQSLGLNVIAAKATAAIKIVEEFASKVNAISKGLGLKDEDFEKK